MLYDFQVQLRESGASIGDDISAIFGVSSAVQHEAAKATSSNKALHHYKYNNQAHLKSYNHGHAIST